MGAAITEFLLKVLRIGRLDYGPSVVLQSLEQGSVFLQNDLQIHLVNVEQDIAFQRRFKVVRHHPREDHVRIFDRRSLIEFSVQDNLPALCQYGVGVDVVVVNGWFCHLVDASNRAAVEMQRAILFSAHRRIEGYPHRRRLYQRPRVKVAPPHAETQRIPPPIPSVLPYRERKSPSPARSSQMPRPRRCLGIR